MHSMHSMTVCRSQMLTESFSLKSPGILNILCHHLLLIWSPSSSPAERGPEFIGSPGPAQWSPHASFPQVPQVKTGRGQVGLPHCPWKPFSNLFLPLSPRVTIPFLRSGPLYWLVTIAFQLSATPGECFKNTDSWSQIRGQGLDF